MKNFFHKAINAHTMVHIFWVLLFVFFIAFPITGLFSTPDPSYIARVEKRLPATFPATFFKKEFFKQFEMWYSDHYPYKYELVRFFSKNYAELAGVSIRPHDVVLGKEEWLFLGNRFNQIMSRYRGQQIPSAEQVAAAEARYGKLHHDAKSRNVPIVIAVAPDKQRIASEFLPQWVLPGSDGPGIVAVIRELAQSGINLLWLLPAVEEAKNHLHPLPVAFEYDSHWNGASGFFAFKTIMAELDAQMDGLFIPDANDYVFRSRAGESDLTKILMLPEVPSTDVYAVPLRFDLPEHVIRTEFHADGHSTEEASPLTPKHLRGASSPRLTFNHEAPMRERALLITDSFGTALEPYFIQHFHETVRVSTAELLERGGSIQALCYRFAPSFLVFVVTERNSW